MNTLEGACLCASVQYRVTAAPLVTALCHCTHCQRQSGSAFSVNVGIPKGSLTLTAGRTTVFADTGSSGQPVYRHFCGRCGSPIFSEVVARPTLDWLKAGTLNDTSWVKPELSIWCDSAQAWFSQPAQIRQFQQGPTSS
jgi:hypothetical protein